MNAEDFEKVLAERLDKIRRVLAVKADEYATADRLHNFKRGAEEMRCSPLRTCLSYMTKHWVSVLDLVDDAEAGKVDRVRRLLDEKIGDLVNYVILLEANFLELCRDAETSGRDRG